MKPKKSIYIKHQRDLSHIFLTRPEIKDYFKFILTHDEDGYLSTNESPNILYSLNVIIFKMEKEIPNA